MEAILLALRVKGSSRSAEQYASCWEHRSNQVRKRGDHDELIQKSIFVKGSLCQPEMNRDEILLSCRPPHWAGGPLSILLPIVLCNRNHKVITMVSKSAIQHPSALKVLPHLSIKRQALSARPELKSPATTTRHSFGSN